MKTFLAVLAFAALAACTSGCADHPYTGPTIDQVGVTGAYTDQDGETFSGGVTAHLVYPTPTPRPAVDHSK